MFEELDQSKYHVLTPEKRRILIFAGLLLSLIILPILFYSYYSFAIYRPAQNIDETAIEIPSGSGLSEIASSLYEKDLLNSEFLFKLYVLLNNFDENIQAGVYIIPAGTSIMELSDILQHGTNDISITFIEGWRVEEYARLANEKLENIDYEDFIDLAKSSEGYLYPDTYYVNREIEALDLIEILKKTFDEKTGEVMTPTALSGVGMTKEQVVTLASIVEREVYKEEDRPIVAGVLIKRWKNNELVGADATTQYALAAIKFGCDPQSSKVCPSDDQAREINWWPNPGSFTKEEIALENPYNTRAVVGLPPAPISNPGISAIKALLSYQKTDFNYYATDSDGNTYFARTLEEHEANVSRYLR